MKILTFSLFNTEKSSAKSRGLCLQSDVILLSYFMEMSDADIAREMNLVRSTIHEHRTRSLEILRKIMEGIADEKDV